MTTDGKNLVSHAGTALLSELADRSGLTEAMSVAMAECGISWHTHDPGVVLTHLGVAIADGADCLADMASLKTVRAVRSGGLGRHRLAGRAGHDVCRAPGHPGRYGRGPPTGVGRLSTGGPLILDFDATLVNSHSEKEDAAPTYKKGFGFFPLGVWCDTTNEPLAAMLRPGNAGANDTDDHLELLDRALSAVPPEYRLATSKVTTRPGRPPDPGAGRLGRGHPPLRRGPLPRQLRLLHRLPHRRLGA